MLRSTRILPALLISALTVMSACTNRAPSLRMLDTRAGYDSGMDDAEVAIYQRNRAKQNSAFRTLGPRIAKVYVFPHELPSEDYFWGGYISLIIHRDEVIYDNPESQADDDAQQAPPPIQKLKATRGKSSPHPAYAATHGGA